MTPGYSAEEMRRYWREHSRLWRDLDRYKDPEGLTNVCYNGAPLWLNRFASRCQIDVFTDLLRETGPVEGRRVLDVGCGVGRWTRLLSGMGAEVYGIDLQPETLADDRKRLPGCRFFEMSADAIGFADASFDMASSVTVVQHMPPAVQSAALREVRRVLRPGGWFIFLEGIADRGAHVFSRRVDGWVEEARSAGFEAVRVLPYDFAPLIHALRNLSGRLHGSARTGPEHLEPVEEYVARFRKGPAARGLARRIFRLALRGATVLSYPLEPVLRRVGGSGMAHHAGILFRAA